MASSITDRSSGVGTPGSPNGENATISMKVPVRVATTANITLSGAQTIDGVSVVAGNRVLVKNQTDASGNGIYVAATGAWTRAQDCADDGDLVTGTEVRVNSGTANAGRWYCSSADPIDIGTDNITWERVTGIVIGDGNKGDVTVSGSGAVWTINASSVEFSMIQNVANMRVLGNVSGDAAAPAEVPILDEDDMTSNSAVSLATQQSIVAYIAAQLAAFSGGSSIIRNWLPTDASFPASTYPTLDTRNTIPILDFNDSANEVCYFIGVMPDNYDGENCEVELFWAATSATSGNFVWAVIFDKLSGGTLTGYTFDTGQVSVAAVSGTAGDVFSTTISVVAANLDGLVAGDLFRLLVTRQGANGSDTATGDAELVAVEMRIQ